jgi:NAD(P)-dependent dehydrogenase (short-subunit alcohol dehydrogenase family)
MVSPRGGAVALSEADWDLVIDTNLKSMFLTWRAVLIDGNCKAVLVH